ncbi:MAG: hypothetical protein AAFV85_24555 [Cyanobacteria bacterium J06634_6]
MDILAKQLDTKLHEWEPETAAKMRQVISELMGLADQGILDIMRSRSIEQEVMDLLDAPKTR